MAVEDGSVRHMGPWVVAAVVLSFLGLGVTCLMMYEGVHGVDLQADPAMGRLNFALGFLVATSAACGMFIVGGLAVNVVHRFGPVGKMKNKLVEMAVVLALVAAFATAAYLIVIGPSGALAGLRPQPGQLQVEEPG